MHSDKLRLNTWTASRTSPVLIIPKISSGGRVSVLHTHKTCPQNKPERTNPRMVQWSGGLQIYEPDPCLTHSGRPCLRGEERGVTYRQRSRPASVQTSSRSTGAVRSGPVEREEHLFNRSLKKNNTNKTQKCCIHETLCYTSSQIHFEGYLRIEVTDNKQLFLLEVI